MCDSCCCFVCVVLFALDVVMVSFLVCLGFVSCAVVYLVVFVCVCYFVVSDHCRVYGGVCCLCCMYLFVCVLVCCCLYLYYGLLFVLRCGVCTRVCFVLAGLCVFWFGIFCCVRLFWISLLLL